MFPDLQYHAVPEMVEEHPASNGSVTKLKERFPDVRHWDLHGKMKGWIDQIPQLEPRATQGHGPHL